MDVIYYIYYSLLDLLRISTEITIGLGLFMFSWVYPRRLVTLPGGESVGRRRINLLTGVGIAGSLFVVAVATITATITHRYGFPDPSGFAGWWRRPAPLFAAVLVVIVAALALRGETLPAPNERAISPHRRWWFFASRPLLWITVSVAALLALTSLWQTAIGRSAPENANQFGMAPVESDLPVFMALYGDYGFIPGAGWPNHLATLAALFLAIAALVFALRSDANRAAFASSTAADVRRVRGSTARLLLLITLGGVAATLGAVWVFTGFIGEIIIGMESMTGTNDYLGGDVAQAVVATGYQEIAWPMHMSGYVIQGMGIALLLRIAVDTARARWSLRPSREDQNKDLGDFSPTAPAPDTSASRVTAGSLTMDVQT